MNRFLVNGGYLAKMCNVLDGLAIRSGDSCNLLKAVGHSYRGAMLNLLYVNHLGHHKLKSRLEGTPRSYDLAGEFEISCIVCGCRCFGKVPFARRKRSSLNAVVHFNKKEI